MTMTSVNDLDEESISFMNNFLQNFEITLKIKSFLYHFLNFTSECLFLRFPSKNDRQGSKRTHQNFTVSQCFIPNLVRKKMKKPHI